MPDNDEFEDLLKSIAASQAKKGDGDNDEDDDYEDDEDDEDDEDEETGDMFGKSFGVTLANGQEAEAVDGTALIKSLTMQLESQQDDYQAVKDELRKTQGALGGVYELVKSLQDDVMALRKSGSGRQSVAMVKSLQPQDFMAKSLRMLHTGKLSSQEVAQLEVSHFNPDVISDDLRNKITQS